MNQFEETKRDGVQGQKRGQERPFTPAAYTQPGRPRVPYTGNGAYCYANSLHICLAAVGANPLPDPGFLECLTLMPFGATFAKFGRRLVFYPSPPNNDPETGLSLALTNLGWDCQQWHGRLFQAKEAFERLRAAVATGPVLLGPVDMGHLRYDPASLN